MKTPNFLLLLLILPLLLTAGDRRGDAPPLTKGESDQPCPEQELIRRGSCSFNGLPFPPGTQIHAPVQYSRIREFIKPFYEALGGKFIVAEISGVKGAFADFNQSHEPRILYNPAFMDEVQSKTRTEWSVASVLGHEVGHHVMQHGIRKEHRWYEEREADRWSGLLMAILQRPLWEATVVMDSLSDQLNGGDYPPTKLRKLSIEQGYNQALLMFSNKALHQTKGNWEQRFQSNEKGVLEFLQSIPPKDLLLLVRDGFRKTSLLLDQFENQNELQQLEHFKQTIHKREQKLLQR